MVASPVKEYAVEKGLPVYQPEKIKNNSEFIQELKGLKPEMVVVVAYGKILPKEILNMPILGCINVHASILPKYRGAAPIQWAVINGDKKTGVTTMYMDEGMDTGDILLKKEVDIGDDETMGELWDRLSNVGAELLVETIKQIENNSIVRTKQNGDFSMAPMLTKELGQIGWKEKTGSEIKNLVRGLNPIMGAYSFIDGKKIKFWKVESLKNDDFLKKYSMFEINKDDINQNPGTIILSNPKAGLFIKTLDGVLSIIELQAENSKRMSVSDFLRGNPLEKYEKFM